MSDEPAQPAAPTTGPSTPPRTLSAAELATALSGAGYAIERRTVLTWPEHGCPCDWTTRRQKRSPSFSLEEVQGWLARSGRGRRRTKADAPTPTPSPTPAPDAGPASAGRPSEPDIFSAAAAEAAQRKAAQAQEMRAAMVAFSGDVDYSTMIAVARVALSRLQETMPETPSSPALNDPAEWQKWSDALKKLSGEVRALEEKRFELEERRAKWIALADTMRVLGELTAVTSSGFESIRPDLARELGAELEKHVDPEKMEGLRRTLSAIIVNVVKNQRQRMADQLAQGARVLAESAGEVPAAKAAS